MVESPPNRRRRQLLLDPLKYPLTLRSKLTDHPLFENMVDTPLAGTKVQGNGTNASQWLIGSD